MPEGLVQPIPYDREAVPFPLGRAMVHHDPRNRLFRALDAPNRAPRANQFIPHWSLDVYDQISDDCTANAAVGLLRTSPHHRAFKAAFSSYDSAGERVALYEAAKDYDPWPGNDYAGTSTDAPFRVLRERGLISEWRWLFGFDEMREWLRKYGPVAVGTNWYDEMFYPDAKDRIVIGGGLSGGHAYRAVYWSPQYGTRVVNSWGRSWGHQGRCWVPDEMMIQLLSEQGEVVTI